MIKKMRYVICFILSLALCLTFLTMPVSATAQDPVSQGTQESQDSSDGQSEVEYQIQNIKEKIYMLPGENRMASLVIPQDSVFESSNSKIACVANSGLITAVKAGTVKLTHTTGNVKYVYTVVVRDEVDLIVFAGQSNMCGSGGNASQAPTPSQGTAYEFDITTKSKRTILMKEPFGEGTNRNNGLENSGKYSTKGTLVSAFCINYYKQTKVPVIGVSSAFGGSSTNTWLNRGLLKQTQKNLKLVKAQLKKNKIKIRHIYMVWYQGESDAAQSVSEKTYISRMKKIYSKMKRCGVEHMFIIRIGHDMAAPDRNYTIMRAQENLCKKNNNFTMVSKKASKYAASYPAYYSDTIHLNQKALNQVGYEAGKAAGKYAKKHSGKK